MTSSSRGLPKASTEIVSASEATAFARAFRGMWPQPVADEQAYLSGLAQLFSTMERRQVDAISDPRSGFPSIHKFPPSIAEIQEWISPVNKFTPAEPTVHYGPNFTQERLSKEARGEIEGPKLTLEERKAIVVNILGYDPLKTRVEQPCFIPPPPKVNVSDFPDGPASVIGWTIFKAPSFDRRPDQQTAQEQQQPLNTADLDAQTIDAILDEIQNGHPSGYKYSNADIARDLAGWKAVIRHAPGIGSSKAKQMIAAWLKSGVLVSGPYTNPSGQKGAWGLFVDDARRPNAI